MAFDRIGQAVRSVAGRGKYVEAQRPRLDHVAVDEGGIESVAQGRVIGLQTEDPGEVRLHRADAAADADRGTVGRAQDFDDARCPHAAPAHIPSCLSTILTLWVVPLLYYVLRRRVAAQSPNTGARPE